MADLTNDDKLAIFDEISKDKGMSRQIKKHLAAAHPELDMPEVELSNEIEQIRSQSKEEAEALRNELQATRDELTAKQAEVEFMREHGINKSELEKVTEYMKENSINDLSSGLRLMRLSEQAPRKGPEGYEDRKSMKMSESMIEGLKDRRGHRRRRLFEGLQEVQREARRSEVLSTH